MSNVRTGVELTIDEAGLPRPKWRTPMMTEDAIADATLNVSLTPGSDGIDASPGYSTAGPS